MGTAKAVKIKAALTLAHRIDREQHPIKSPITSSQQVLLLMKNELALLAHEEFWVLYLNQSNRLLKKACLSKGGITQTIVDVRLALKNALQQGATGLILVHNHPSGGLKPSTSDRQITQRFKQAAALFDIRILDHLILSSKGYFSFADENDL
ncbi:MAG: DNA repair protein RadC [Flavobacteriaceae bacterium]